MDVLLYEYIVKIKKHPTPLPTSANSSDSQFPTSHNPRNHLNFCISGYVQVECTEALYYDNPDIQNSMEIGDLARFHGNLLQYSTSYCTYSS